MTIRPETQSFLETLSSVHFEVAPLEGLSAILWPPVCGRSRIFLNSCLTPRARIRVLRKVVAQMTSTPAPTSTMTWEIA